MLRESVMIIRIDASATANQSMTELHLPFLLNLTR